MHATGSSSASPGWRLERGSASVVVAAGCVVLLLLGLGAASVVGAAAAAATARTAADLGALAGASARLDQLRGAGAGPAPCAVAAAVVASNHAELTSCVIDGSVNLTVRVRVEVSSLPAWIGRLDAARASARAGPVEPETS